MLPISVVAAATAQPIDVGDLDTRTISFTRIVYEDEQGDLFITDERLRVSVLDELKAHGYEALGGETDLVFGEPDQGGWARVQLGGELRAGRCWDADRTTCELDIEWKVYDVDLRTVTYTHRIQGRWSSASSEKAVYGALTGSLQGLLSEQAFVAAVQGVTLDQAGLTVAACPSPPLALPGDLETAMNSVLLVELPDGVGSAVVISPDGFALTASHVVGTADTVVAHTRQGLELEAQVIRRNPSQDVALLKLPGKGWSCAAPAPADPALGADVYVLGSPGGEELAFSVSRGIVSGHRVFDGTPFVQTDASINPGSSGGPLLDSQGRLLGIATFKIVGEGMEGLGFALPAHHAAAALELGLGEATDTEIAAAPSIEPVVGTWKVGVRPDWPEEPLGASSSKPAKKSSSAGMDPTVQKGLVVGGVGAVVVLGTAAVFADNGDNMTPETFQALRAANTLGWIAMLGGGGVALYGAVNTSSEGALVGVQGSF